MPHIQMVKYHAYKHSTSAQTQLHFMAKSSVWQEVHAMSIVNVFLQSKSSSEKGAEEWQECPAAVHKLSLVRVVQCSW